MRFSREELINMANAYMHLLDEIGKFQTRTGRKPKRIKLTKQDKLDFSKLTRKEFALAGEVAKHGVEKAVPQINGIPVDWNAPERELEGENAVDAKRVKDRVTDWVSRLEKLYSKLDEWAKALPDVSVRRNTMPQLIEPIMERTSVPAREVPVFSLIVNKKYRVDFIPSSIWIIGANGRVNVTTNSRQKSLVDMGGENSAPSRWHLVGDDPDKPLVPFNREAFLKLLQERK
jgi:hypothetical protein